MWSQQDMHIAFPGLYTSASVIFICMHVKAPAGDKDFVPPFVLEVVLKYFHPGVEAGRGLLAN